MAFKLKYDSRKVDRTKEGDFAPPKPGVYPMQITECVYEEDKNRLVFKLKQLEADKDGAGKNYGYWDYVGLDIDWKIDQYLKAVGVDTEAKETGQMTDKTFLNKKVMGRTRIDHDYDPDNPRGKLVRVMPFREDEDLDEEDEDFDEDDTELEDEVDEDADDLEQLGSDADEGDEDSIMRLTELAGEAGLDPDEYATWAELAEALGEKSEEEAEEEEEPEEESEEEEEAEDDYESWTPDDLRAELETRELSTKGSKSAMVARLRANDADPF